MSAWSAVSVRKCSCTTVNRSSRWKPAPPWRLRAPPPPGCCCRPPAPRAGRPGGTSRSRSSPMVLMLMRAGRAPPSRSRPLQRGVATCEPARAGQQQAAAGSRQSARPGPAGWRSAAPRCRRRTHAACRGSGGSPPAPSAVVARQLHHLLLGVMPQTSAVRSGVQARASRAVQPALGVARDVVVVSQSLTMSSRIRPSASAIGAGQQRDVLVALVGRSRSCAGRCRSAAPLRLACYAKVQKCRLEAIELLPQMRISGSRRSAPGACRLAAMGRFRASPPALAQMVRSSSEAPRRWKKRRPMLALQQAHGAGVA